MRLQEIWRGIYATRRNKWNVLNSVAKFDVNVETFSDECRHFEKVRLRYLEYCAVNKWFLYYEEHSSAKD